MSRKEWDKYISSESSDMLLVQLRNSFDEVISKKIRAELSKRAALKHAKNVEKQQQLNKE